LIQIARFLSIACHPLPEIGSCRRFPRPSAIRIGDDD
jgi:hypothetical protein